MLRSLKEINFMFPYSDEAMTKASHFASYWKTPSERESKY